MASDRDNFVRLLAAAGAGALAAVAASSLMWKPDAITNTSRTDTGNPAVPESVGARALNLRQVITECSTLEELGARLEAEGGVLFVCESSARTGVRVVHHVSEHPNDVVPAGVHVAIESGKPAPLTSGERAFPIGESAVVVVPGDREVDIVGADALLRRLVGLHASFESRRRLHELISVMSEVSSAEDHVDATRAVLRAAYKLLGCQRVTLFSVDRRNNRLIIRESRDAVGVSIPMTRGIAGHVASTGGVVNVPDAYRDSRFDSSVDKQTGFRTKSILCVPVRDGQGRIVAVLQAVNRLRAPWEAMPSADETEAFAKLADGDVEPRIIRRETAYGFSPGDEEVLEALGLLAGQELTRVLSIEALRRARNTTAALLEVAQAAAAEGSFQGFVSRVVSAAYRVTGAERVSLFLVDPSRDELVMAHSSDAAGTRISMRRGFAGSVARTGRSVNVRDAYADRRFDPSMDRQTGFRTKAVLSVPVVLPSSATLRPMGKRRSEHTDSEDRRKGLRPLTSFVALASVDAPDSSSSDEGESSGVRPVAVLQAVNKVGGGFFDAQDLSALRALCMHVAVSIKQHSVEDAIAQILARARPSQRRLSTFDKGSMSERDDEEDGDESSDARSGSSLWGAVRKHKVVLSLLSAYSGDRRGGMATQVAADVVLRYPTTVKEVDWKDVDQKGSSHNLAIGDPLRNWTFDPFATHEAAGGGDAGDATLGSCFVRLIRHLSLDRRLGLDAKKLSALVQGVRGRYHDNPFHNWFHAVGVAQASFVIIESTSAHLSLHYLDMFAILVAALSHDIDHPGVANNYLIASSSPLALAHNDDAPLERHHASTASKLLRHADTNVFSHLHAEDRRWVRKLILRAILGTDMGRHAAQLSSMRQRIARLAFDSMAASGSSPAPPASPRASLRRSSMRTSSDASSHPVSPRHQNEWGRSASVAVPANPANQVVLAFNKDLPDDRLELAEFIVHTADLSGQAYPWPIAAKWSKAVNDEFLAQVQREEEEGLPSLPFMCGLDDPLVVAFGQHAFVTNVVLPLYSEMGSLLNGLDTPIDHLRSNAIAYDLETKRLERARNPHSSSAESDPIDDEDLEATLADTDEKLA